MCDSLNEGKDWTPPEQLALIQEKMLELLNAAKKLIRTHAKSITYERAKNYWLAHMEIALTQKHGYLSGSMCTMDDTIEEMDDNYNEEE